MSPVTTNMDATSRITLALMEDSGWYHVDYDKAEKITWGRELGCNFAMKSCLTWMKSHRKDPIPYCITYGDSRCSANRFAKLHCNLAEVRKRDIPPEFNYNIEDLYMDKRGDRIYGAGTVEQADFCPYYMVTDLPSSVNSAFDSRCTLLRNAIHSSYSLEVFSRWSRCFEVQSASIVTAFFSREYSTKVGCYETLCQDNVLQVRAEESEWYTCNYKGQIVQIVQNFWHLRGVGTVNLRLLCPSCSEICGWEFCSPNISSNSPTYTNTPSTTSAFETSITKPSETSMTRSSETLKVSTRYSSISALPRLSSTLPSKMQTISPPQRSSQTPFNMISTIPSDIPSNNSLFDNSSPVPNVFSEDSPSNSHFDKEVNPVVFVSITLVFMVFSAILFLLYRRFYD